MKGRAEAMMVVSRLCKVKGAKRPMTIFHRYDLLRRCSAFSSGVGSGFSVLAPAVASFLVSVLASLPAALDGDSKFWDVSLIAESLAPDAECGCRGTSIVLVGGGCDGSSSRLCWRCWCFLRAQRYARIMVTVEAVCDYVLRIITDCRGLELLSLSRLIIVFDIQLEYREQRRGLLSTFDVGLACMSLRHGGAPPGVFK